MIQLKVPGKLFIVGEYSVIKPGNEAIIVAVDKFIHIQVEAASNYEFSSELGRFKWMISESLPVFRYDTLKHAKAAIYMAHVYLSYQKITSKPYKITLSSELANEENQKYGLGSSGAVIVAVIQGILAYHGLNIRKKDLFKLAVLAQIEINDVTSGGELAASIYGGWVHYTRYDLIWVMNHKGKVDEIINMTWPHLSIERLPANQMSLAVCYSGISQSTSEMIERVKTFETNPWYANFLNKTKIIVAQFKEAFMRSDYYTVKHMIELYRKSLQQLQVKTGIIIESKPFQKMIDIAESYGYPAKTSGAGFGDCGIAILSNDQNKIMLHDAWIKAGLTPLEIKVWAYESIKKR